MRRHDREIKDKNEILEIMDRCDVCRLAFNDGDYPYILPLNFGIEEKDGHIILYFHSALEGYKTELIKSDNRVSFEMDCKHELKYDEGKGYCTMAYESVIGRGRIEVLPNDEKENALRKIMGHYHHSEDTYFNPAAIPRTLVYMLMIEEMTAKRKL